jgi:hypothetical protein
MKHGNDPRLLLSPLFPSLSFPPSLSLPLPLFPHTVFSSPGKSDNRKVWLMGHIAPRIDLYSNSNAWQDPFLQSFLEVTGPYLGEVIKMSAFAQEHKVFFKLQTSSSFFPNSRSFECFTSLQPNFQSVYLQSHNSIFSIFKTGISILIQVTPLRNLFSLQQLKNTPSSLKKTKVKKALEVSSQMGQFG